MTDDAPRLAPDAGSLASAHAEVRETLISVIVLVGDRAVKIKKPVHLPYLDWRALPARRAACQREVELNRRLAPDVYLGTADVAGADGCVFEHLVVMRRMPEERRLAGLVARGAPLDAPLDRLAAHIAAFHATAARSPAISDAAGRDAVRRNWEDNLAVLHDAAGTRLDSAGVARVDHLAHAYLAGRGPLFADRAAAGMAVDGHGDLLADDIYLLDDGPRVLDCLEFDDRLRAVDVLDDVAFLAMDLEHLGAPSLARAFLGAYRRHSAGHHPASLAHHYIAYRAGVRAKVAVLRAVEGTPGASSDARDLLDLARRHLEVGRVRLVLVGGLPGTGKSTLARALGARAGWPVLRSDVVRKERAGIASATRAPAGFGEGLYAPVATDATYRELLRRARRLLERGESVVLDASFASAAHRAGASTVAKATAAELVALQCQAPATLAAERLARRRRDDPSDATPAIAAAMAASFAPWPEAAVIDTSADPDAAVDAAAAALGPLEPAN